MIRPTVAALTASLLASAALATPPAAPVLSGPKVQTPASNAKPTLVRRDFSGKLVRLDVHPAEAAVKLLTLDDQTRAKVDAILLERSRLLDQLVTENLPLLVQLQSARASGDKKAAARCLAQLSEKAQPLRDRGQLAQQLLAVLPPEQGRQLKSLIQEYWAELVREELASKAGEQPTPDPSPRRADMRQVMRQQLLAIAGDEIRRAYERTISARAADFNDLLKDLNLTAEQESRIRKIVGDAFQNTGGNPTPQDHARAFAQVWPILDQSQQTALIRRLNPAPEPSTQPAAK